MKEKLQEAILSKALDEKVLYHLADLISGGRSVKRENLIRDMVTECLNEIEPGFYSKETDGRKDLINNKSKEIVEFGHNMVFQPVSWTLNKISTDYNKRKGQGIASRYFFCHVITVFRTPDIYITTPKTYRNSILKMTPESILLRLNTIEQITQQFDHQCIHAEVIHEYDASNMELHFFIGEIKTGDIN